MHKFTHLVYLVIIAVMGILIYTQQPQEASNSEELQAEQPADNSAKATTDNETQSAENAALRELQAEVDYLKTLLEHQQRSEEKPNGVEQTADPDPVRTNSDGPSREELNMTTDFEARKASMLKLIDEEEKDTEWAYQTETAISDLFYTESDLANAEIEELECRSTICKIVVSTEDEKLLQTPDLLNSAIRHQAGIKSSYSTMDISPEDQYIQILMEVSREGENDGADE